MRIRRAELTDVPELSRIRASVRENRLLDPASVKPEDYHSMLEERGRGWVAEVGGETAGFAIGDLDRGNVWALFVDPKFEGRGVGRQLHDTMMAWFFSAGAPAVELSTEPGTRAATFYERAGWTRTGVEPSGEVRYELSAERWSLLRPSATGT